jgi:hypothetical protein
MRRTRLLSDNVPVTRRLVALALTLAVPVGALCAPFLHAHVEEDAEHHEAASIHAHFSGHAPAREAHDGVTIDHPDHDRPIYLQVFVAMQAGPFEIPAVAQAPFDIPTPPERTARPPVEVTHGHDPPGTPSTGPRAPPFRTSSLT